MLDLLNVVISKPLIPSSTERDRRMNLNLNGMVSMWKVRELVDKATNIVMNYTETEAKVGYYFLSWDSAKQ